jgi:hypothetical protein
VLPSAHLTTVAHAIQLAVAPVFLLAGLAGILNMLAGRLARVVDRARSIEAQFVRHVGAEHDRQVWELRRLDRRMTVINWALFLCTASAMAICIVVALLFMSALAKLGFGRTVASLFILAMMMLTAGLSLFLIEVRISIRSIRVRDELLERSRS